MGEFHKSELEIARMCGLSPEEFKTARLQEAKETAINSMMTPDELKVCTMMGVEPVDFLKTAGRLDLNTMLTRDEIETCSVLNVDPLDFYFAKKFKC